MWERCCPWVILLIPHCLQSYLRHTSLQSTQQDHPFQRRQAYGSFGLNAGLCPMMPTRVTLNIWTKVQGRFIRNFSNLPSRRYRLGSLDNLKILLAWDRTR